MDSEQQPRQSSSIQPPAERRERPRVAPALPLCAKTDLGQRFSVMNVSVGGALLHGPFELALGEVLDLRFVVPDVESSILLAARVVYVMRVTAAGGPSYMAGVEFVHDAPEAIERLMIAATATPA
jgi:hypothetical protein